MADEYRRGPQFIDFHPLLAQPEAGHDSPHSHEPGRN
jgi:hypothetical protein